jgi:ferritin-like metal-binding protein YciE
VQVWFELKVAGPGVALGPNLNDSAITEKDLSSNGYRLDCYGKNPRESENATMAYSATVVKICPKERTVKKSGLKELYIDELRDLYNAENQLTKALPKMAKASTSDELRAGFEEHLEQTKGHVERLERIFKQLDEKPTGKKCKGMEGLVEESKEIIDEQEGETLDAGLISAAQRVEHYEIAAYGCVRTYANLLGEDNAAELLEQTLKEEKETDQKLTKLAEKINVEAEEEGEERSNELRGKGKAARA